MSEIDRDEASDDSRSSEKDEQQAPPSKEPLIPGLNMSDDTFYKRFVPLFAAIITIVAAWGKSGVAQAFLIAISIGFTYLFVQHARGWQFVQVVRAMTIKERLSWLLGWTIATLLVYWILSSAPNAWGSRDPQYKSHDILPGGYVQVEIVAPCPSLGLVTIATGRTNDPDPRRSWSAGQVRLQLRSGSVILAENVNQPHSYMGSTITLRLPVTLDVGKRYQIRAINESPNSIPFLMTGDKEVEVRKFLSVPRTFLSRDRPFVFFNTTPRDHFYDGVPDMHIESMCSG